MVWNKADITRTKTDRAAKMVLQWSRWKIFDVVLFIKTEGSVVLDGLKRSK